MLQMSQNDNSVRKTHRNKWNHFRLHFTFCWGDYECKDRYPFVYFLASYSLRFTSAINPAKNLFLLPRGKVTKSYFLALMGQI